MNRQAAVVDAWRKIRVAADALEPGLDVFAEAKVGTEPGNNPLAFSSSASSYRVGVSFDGPLNRKAERNIYRTDLIEYQRARRGYLAGRDAIVQSVRLDVRKLTAERLEFEIARQSLITAARQVELARIQLLAPGQAAADSSTTQDVLDALNRLLEAKNALIAVWIAVETDRLQLLLDTEALQLDERGLVTDDDFDPNDRTSTLELLPPGQPERDRGAD
jgi:outer membrane protein TolC